VLWLGAVAQNPRVIVRVDCCQDASRYMTPDVADVVIAEQLRILRNGPVPPAVALRFD